MIRIIPPLLGLLVLGACATPHEAEVPIPGTADAERALLASMAKVEAAADTLGGRSVSAGTFTPSGRASAPAELNQRLKYRAKGSLDDVARAIATSVGFHFASNATTATRKVDVSVDAESEPAVDILRSLGTQAGKAADVVVRPSDRLVEVRYRA